MTKLALALGFSLALGAVGPVLAQDDTAAEEETPKAPACIDPVDPVIALNYGSRYQDGSEGRSDVDEDSNAEVTKALKPVDGFIADLARLTDYLQADTEEDTSLAEIEDRLALANCVIDRIDEWASADALSDLATPNARLSAPSRVGGIAFAYAAVRDRVAADERTARIDTWFRDRAAQTMTFFDTDAPTRASRNNLRAWAGLAVARVGLTLDDAALMDWGAASAMLVACEANADGSLPNEMWRGRLALHYQLHAVAPLVVTAALLNEKRPGLFEQCDRAIPRIVEFTLAGLADPAPVEEITGKEQSVGGPDDPPRDFELAWAEAYLRFNESEDLRARIAEVEKLGNSKLGGDQRLLW
ncbi:MAG: alginate lyase [Tabrizicola sp.]|nr:alginate lyase [Tabrizicola sp.]